MQKLLVLLVIISFSVSCSKSKKSGNSNTLQEKTTQIKEQLVISKEADDIRNTKFDVLTSDKEKLGAKIAAAAVYFQSFEFQLWTGDDKTREVLFLDAANEFTKRISDIYEELNLKKMSPTNEGKKFRNDQAFYAIALTMHMNHHYQEELVDLKANAKAISFFDIMKSALKKDYNAQAMSQHEEVLVSGINKEIMIELIKARVDIYSALALKNLTDKRNVTFRQKFKAIIFKLTGGKYGSIELPEVFAKSNAPTKKQTILYLDAATKAKNFLDNIGVEKDLEESLRSAYSKISLGDSEEKDEPTEEDGEEPEQMVETKEVSDADKAQIQELIHGLLE